jgi:hypothetical protein
MLHSRAIDLELWPEHDSGVEVTVVSRLPIEVEVAMPSLPSLPRRRKSGSWWAQRRPGTMRQVVGAGEDERGRGWRGGGGNMVAEESGGGETQGHICSLSLSLSPPLPPSFPLSLSLSLWHWPFDRGQSCMIFRAARRQIKNWSLISVFCWRMNSSKILSLILSFHSLMSDAIFWWYINFWSTSVLLSFIKHISSLKRIHQVISHVCL